MPPLDDSTEGSPSRAPGQLAEAGPITLAVLASRVLGVLRETIFAVLFGASWVADAYVIAFRIPNLLRDMFAEGALSAAFVPSFTERQTKEGRESAQRLFSLTLGAALTLTGILTVLAIIFAGTVVDLIAPGFAASAEKHELATSLTRVMMPFLPLISATALVMGVLNSNRRFFVPAAAPALFNVVSIVAGAAIYLVTSEPVAAAWAWSVAVILAGLAQIAVQIPALGKTGYRLRLVLRGAWEDPGLRRIAQLMGPAVLGLAIVQINIFVNSVFASLLGDGPLSHLNYAFRVYYLPIGLFGVALGTVATTASAEAAARGDLDALKTNTSRALRNVFLLTLPSVTGLIALSMPTVRLLFEYGRFTPADTTDTALVLSAYVTGLTFASVTKVLAPVFYALDRPRFPVAASITAVIVNIAFNWATYRTLGAPGLALGTALGSLAGAAVQLTAAGRLLPGFGMGSLAVSFLRLLLAAALTGGAAWGLWQMLEANLGTMLASVAGRIPARLLVTFLPIGAAVAIYALLLRLVKAPEADELFELLGKVRRKVMGRTGP
ncbi:MAG: murein biosynthesis integral membrane protein MurJ [Deltaproteobacteria bacterium]|nr:murein biosynthesis integral membrane protein MurJ [Deltaproteobacteria bacterium]